MRCQEHTLEYISIHVPAWGTTCSRDAYDLVKSISIHVPAWGTTWTTQSQKVKNLRISIHVPAWGTTEYDAERLPGRVHFNPRSRVGNDESI